MQDSGIMKKRARHAFCKKKEKVHVIKRSHMKITPWNDDNTSGIVNFNLKAKYFLSIQSEYSEYAT